MLRENFMIVSVPVLILVLFLQKSVKQFRFVLIDSFVICTAVKICINIFCIPCSENSTLYLKNTFIFS